MRMRRTRARGRRRGVVLLLMILVLAAGAVWAQEWTIQTVAVRDLREAQLTALDLTSLGYDAYTEFTMSEEGLQYVRVRVGCFYDVEGAERIAELLRTMVTREAVVVERSPGAPARGCLRSLVGFVPPGAWDQPQRGVPTFVVEVAGVRGVVRFMEGRWRVMQDPAADALPPGEPGPAVFREVVVGGRPYVRVRRDDDDLFVCAGRMLAQTEAAVVVEVDGIVLACSWTAPGDEADPA